MQEPDTNFLDEEYVDILEHEEEIKKGARRARRQRAYISPEACSAPSRATPL